MKRELVVCESDEAFTTHLRDVSLAPLSYEGHPVPRPLSLCGAEVAWDTRLPIESARCGACLFMLSADRE